MGRNGIELRAQARLIAANVRGARGRAGRGPSAPAHRPLAEVLPMRRPLPRLAHPPTTRCLDGAGRARVRIGGQDLRDLLGWAPGPLCAEGDGDWVVLRPAPGPARRNDGTSALCADGRLRLSAAVRTRLGVAAGEEVSVLVLPSSGAVALCHPARLLTGAPLDLVAAEGSGDE